MPASSEATKDLIPETAYRLVRLSEIDANPFNVRAGPLTGIAQLADTIERHGLLENLVVVEIPPEARAPEREGRPPPPTYELRAGTRRYAAIEKLIEEERWDPERLVPVMIVDGDGLWENLVENIQRTEVHAWDIGRRLSECSSAGMSHREIGLRLGRSNGWVSRYVTIGRGLHPDTCEYILKRKLTLKVGDLFRLALIVDREGSPDGEAQIQAIARKRTRRSNRYTSDAIRAFGSRLTYMRTQMPVPPSLRPLVESVLNYIEGGERPKLRELEAQLLEVKRQFIERE